MDSNKTITITGSSRGIGKAVVLKCAHENHKVVAVTRNTGCFKNLHPNIIPVYCDVTSPEGREEVVNRMRDLNIQTDVLLHNAGLLIKKDFQKLTEADLLDMYRVNTVAPMLFTQSLIDSNLIKDKSSITCISSIGGVEDSSKFPGLSGYGASKAAVNAAVQHMAVELKGHYINAIAPGAVATEMQKEAFPGYSPSLNADDFAEFVAYFITTGYRFFNGQIIKVKLSDPD